MATATRAEMSLALWILLKVDILLVLLFLAADWAIVGVTRDDYGRCHVLGGPLVRLVGRGTLRVSWDSCALPTTSASWAIGDGEKQAGAVATERKGWFREVHAMDVSMGSETGEDATLRLWIGEKTVDVAIAPGIVKDAPLVVAATGTRPRLFASSRGVWTQVAKSRPDVLVTLGNMVRDGSSLLQWHALFCGVLSRLGVLAAQPMVFVPGTSDAPESGGLPDLLGPGDRGYYAASVGAMRLIVLDSNDLSATQLEWLRDELASDASASAAFRVVLVHVPPFLEWRPRGGRASPSDAASGVAAVLRAAAVPLFEAGRVSLVLSGRVPAYQRGAHRGVAYVASGDARAADAYVRDAAGTPYAHTSSAEHHVRLEVSDDALRVSQVLSDGALGDTLVLSPRAV